VNLILNDKQDNKIKELIFIGDVPFSFMEISGKRVKIISILLP